MKFLKGLKFLNSIKEDREQGKGTMSSVLNSTIGLKWKIIIFLSISGIFLLFVVIIAVLISLGVFDVGGLTGSSSSYLASIYKECESIVVGNTAYTLDEYVAGVVSNEAYVSEGMEALKAQAIAARTFVVNSGLCNSTVANSDSFQTFTSNFSDRAQQAANETSGMVLLYNDKVFSSQYDSYCYQDGDCPDSTCNDTECSVTYKRLPDETTHTITIPSSYKNRFVAGGGHARGMSQLLSYEMAKNGSSYEEILKYFYSDGVTIGVLTATGLDGDGTLAADINGFSKRVSQPYSDNKFYFTSLNLSYATGFTGQCTWYAYGRANETLAKAGSTLSWRYAPHAKYWYDMNLKDGSNGFKSTTDVTKPQVGAIIVWSSASYGHVGFVEAVNPNGTIDISEANINSVRSDSNPYGWRYVSGVPYTTTGLGTVSNIWSGYTFVGYIYMLD